MPEMFVALDGEMSGTTPRHQLIQIGVAVTPQQVFVSDIGCGCPLLDPDAMAVNGFTKERVLSGPRAQSRDPDGEGVDDQLYRWLVNLGAEERRCIPVGWNVGSFDMPFVRRTLPRTATLFGYRAVDLNSACFTLAGCFGQVLRKQEPGWAGWKRMSKRYAERRLAEMGYTATWHDAGYDAQAALLSWEFLKKVIQDPKGALALAS